MNNPKLRFKREDSTDYPEWKDTSLGKIGDVAMCKRILKEQTTENGDVPFFKISTFGGTPDAYISYQLFDDFRQIYRFPQKGAILISAAGTIGKTVRYNGEDAYYQDSNIVWLEHDDSVVDDFLYQFYQQVSWEGLEGSTIKRLYNKNLLETPISLPCLEEQQKIADFLSTVDEVIAQSEAEVQNLEQQKKAAMQKIFSQEVRFKREDGTDYPDWETVSLGSLYQKNNERNGNQFCAEKTISIATMRFNEKGNGAKEESISNYKVLRVGDIAFEGHENREFSHGRFVLNDVGDGIMSPRFSCLRPRKTMVNGFWKYYIHYEPVMYNVLVCSTKKGTMMHELVYEDFYLQSILVPDTEEQKKIADFLSAYDEAINYAKQELDKWKELKKGLLQQMFV